MKLLDTIKRIFNEYQNKSEENMEILKENLLNIFRGVDDGITISARLQAQHAARQEDISKR